MFIKNLFPHRDYQTTLRRRLWLFLAMTLVGILAIVLSRTVLQNGSFPDFIKGFYLGAGCGLTLCGVFFLVRNLWLMQHPTAAHKAQVSEQDEREQAIVKEAMNTVFRVLYVITVGGLFISLPFSRTVFLVLFCQLMVITLTLFSAIAWYKRHM